MAKQTLSLRIHIAGLQTTLNAFKFLPKDATAELRAKTKELSEEMAHVARSAASRDEAPQTRLLIPTIKAVRDRLPAVQVGGTRRVGRHQVAAYNVLFGSEFGMSSRSGWYAKRRYKSSDGLQYHREHNGNTGYWFFPTVEAEEARIARAWREVADSIISEWED